VEKGAPREPRARRRAWLAAAAAAVPGGKGCTELALALREEEERGEGVVELAGWF
jgi:hypothetical protein